MTWHPEAIGGTLRRELGRLGPAASLGPVAGQWPTLVGPAIAANAWPSRVARDGSLHVTTSSSAWAFELTQLAGEIEERLRVALGPDAPARLRFAVGRLPERGAESEKDAQRTVPRVQHHDRVEGERLAAAIEDPELRALVARAAAASLARARAAAADR